MTTIVSCLRKYLSAYPREKFVFEAFTGPYIFSGLDSRCSHAYGPARCCVTWNKIQEIYEEMLEND